MDFSKAKIIYNSETKMYQYILNSGQVLLTRKSKNSLKKEWEKYKRVWNQNEESSLIEKKLIGLLNSVVVELENRTGKSPSEKSLYHIMQGFYCLIESKKSADIFRNYCFDNYTIII